MANIEKKTEDYVESVAHATGNSKKATRIILKEFLSQVIENTKNGIPSKFVGLGAVEIREVAGGEKRNPRTGQKVMVEAHKKPKFKFSGKIRDDLRGIAEDMGESEE